jgi:hypothetical protein
MSTEEIAKEAGAAGGGTIREWMDNYGIEKRKKGDAIRHKLATIHPTFFTNKKGYETVCGRHSDEIYRLHRLVMIAEHGVDAVADMDVHHKNEIPWDNRPENLELLTKSEHTKLHQQAEDSTAATRR